MVRECPVLHEVIIRNLFLTIRRRCSKPMLLGILALEQVRYQDNCVQTICQAVGALKGLRREAKDIVDIDDTP